MAETETIDKSPLKGSRFAAKLEAVCKDPLPSHPLPDLKYRRILLPHMIGGEIYYALLGFIGQGLRIRGAEVTALQCDEFLPACTMRKVDHYDSACTRWCHKNAEPFSLAMRLPYRWYSEFITDNEKNECDRIAAHLSPNDLATLEYKDIFLGEHIARSIESFFKIGQFDPFDPKIWSKGREFARSALYLTVVGFRVLDELKIDKLLLEDGKKVDWGVLRSVAAHKSIPVDCIRAALRGYSIRFEYDRPPQKSILMPEWETWKHISLTTEQEQDLDEYLQIREKVPFEYRSSEWQAHLCDIEQVRQLIGLPAQVEGKVFSVFPNVSFDAGLTKTVAAFSNANEWVAETVQYIQKWPQHHMVIKVHPAEHHRQAQDALTPYLERRFRTIPKNVHLVPADTEITAQAVARLSDWALAFTSTVSVEAAAIGVPVMLVGGGWNAGRGFTLDITTPQEYFEKLEDLCSGKLNYTHPLELARRYAYALFFRSNIPVSFFKVLNINLTSLNINSLADLAPGQDSTIDIICRSVLLDEPMEFPNTWNKLARAY